MEIISYTFSISWLILRPSWSETAFLLRLITTLVIACNAHAIHRSKFLEHDAISAASATSLRTELIHRDHYSSPLRNADDESMFERVREAVALSHARARGIAAKMAAAAAGGGPSQRDVVSPLSSDEGSYLMVVQLATPPQTIQAVADTGSDLLWVRCKPFQGSGGPVLNPKTSPSYRPIPCVGSQCKALASDAQCTSSRSCGFSYGYGDGSTLAGDFSTETLTMTATDGNPQKFTNFSFGCAHQASGTIESIGGLVGLGRGPVSLPSQLSDVVDRKFSYCLVSFFDAPSKTSPLVFGDSATLQATAGVQTTPILQNKPVDTYYYLELRGITIGTATVAVPEQPTSVAAGTIIDSGTTLTYLSSAPFDEVFQAFQQATSDLPQVDGSSAGLQYCVDTSGHSNYNFPQLTLHFHNADLQVPASNYLLAIFDSRPDVLCFVMQSNDGFSVDLSIVGNLFQQNTRILYDNVNSQLSFVAAQCDNL